MATSRYASDYSYYSTASTATKPYVLPETKEAERTKARRGVRTKTASKIHINSILGIVFIAVVFVMVFRFTAMNEMSTGNEQLSAQLKEVSAEADMAQLSLDRTTDLNYVENVAKADLGMDFPQNHQVVSVSLNYPDKVVVSENQNEGFWDEVGNFFSGIWEYLS